MLLAIDVGNTETVIGLFSLGAGDVPPAGSRPAPPVPPEPAGLTHHWRLSTVDDRTADEHALLISELLDLDGMDVAEVVSGIGVTSSVPRVTTALRQMASRWFDVPCVVLEPGVRSGMPILYDNPKEVGADRIANAIGAYDLYGGPCIVVDLGTATTFDAISAQGEYLGGAIAPGIAISMDALFQHAAALRRVELVEPRSVIGKSTIESIQSGALYGFAAQVDGMCRRIMDELGPCTVVATGGLAEVVGPFTAVIEHREPWLTLHGLRLVYERNVKTPAG
ncbi:MAG: type III pantothenate kinase [Acidimicrobiales bacterium]